MQPSKLSIITATILSDDGSDGTNDPDAIAMMLLLKMIMIVMMLMLFVDTYHEGASSGGSYPWSGEGSVAE
jgi:hypothetical protein